MTWLYRHNPDVRNNWHNSIADKIESLLIDGGKTMRQLRYETGYSGRTVQRGLAELRKRRKIETETMPRTDAVYKFPNE